jgi:hypothetical protein
MHARLPRSSAQAAALDAAPAAAAPLSFAHRQGIHDASGKLLLKNLTLPEVEEWCATHGEPPPARRPPLLVARRARPPTWAPRPCAHTPLPDCCAGEPPKRARQLWRWMYADRKWVRSLDEADDDAQRFSKAFKATVNDTASLSGGLTIQVGRAAPRRAAGASAPGPAAGGRHRCLLQQLAPCWGGRPGRRRCSSQHAAEPSPARRAAPPPQSVHKASDGTRKIVYSLHGDEGASGTVETVLIPMTNRQGTSMRYTACLSSQAGSGCWLAAWAGAGGSTGGGRGGAAAPPRPALP